MGSTTKESTTKDTTEDENDWEDESVTEEEVTATEVSRNASTPSKDEETSDKEEVAKTSVPGEEAHRPGPSGDPTESANGERANDKSTNTTAPQTASEGTQTSASIPWTFRGPVEGQRESKVTLCNYLGLQTHIMDTDFACHIEGSGTFLLVNEGNNCCLSLFRQAVPEQLSWSYQAFGDSAKQNGCQGSITGMIPMTESALAILYESKTCVLLRSNSGADWADSIERSWFDFDDNVRQKSLIEATFPTLNSSCQFGMLRGYGAEDFKIICADKEELLAHSIVLASRWDDIHNILVHTPEQKSYKVSWASSLVEPVIAHCYGEEPKPLDLVTATGVALAARDFGMPELLTFALRRIKQESAEVSTNLKAYIAASFFPGSSNSKNSTAKTIRNYLACRIQEQLSTLAGSKETQELLKDMEKSHLISLYNDLSKNTGAEETRRQKRREVFKQALQEEIDE